MAERIPRMGTVGPYKHDYLNISSVWANHEILALVPLARAFMAQPNVVSDFDEAKWRSHWGRRLANGSAAIFYATYLNENQWKPIGAIGCVLVTNPNDGVIEAREAFWYVLPEHRGCGPKLLDYFEGWAVERGAKRLWLARLREEGGEDGRRRERLIDAIYYRRGYAPHEVHFCKEIQ